MNDKIGILHLEDSFKDSEIINAKIESAKIEYNYFLADCEKDFLNFLETENIHLILSDYNLPDYNGNEALRVAREKYPHIPFIFVSGKIMEGVAIEKMLNGATDYVFKNNLERLVPAIRRALNDYELETKRKQAEISLQEKREIIIAQSGKYFEINKELDFQNEEKEKRAEELIIAIKNAEESDQLKSAFLRNMSHEIRTPLTAIIGFSNLLNEEDISKAEIKEYISIINQSGNQLIVMITNILDISTILTGLVKVNEKPILIDSFFHGLFTTFNQIARTKNIHLKYQNKNGELKFFYSDEAKLFQIFSNLINNAIKFSESGNVDFGYEIKENTIQFYVKDTGIGIPPELHRQIFENFRQAELSPTRQYEGSGLGLAICIGLLRVLGGKIWLESIVNKGSTFFFSLPYEKMNHR